MNWLISLSPLMETSLGMVTDKVVLNFSSF